MSLMIEYIEKQFGPNELEAELLSLIKSYNERMGTYLLVYASAICKPSIPDISLGMEDFYIIFDILREQNCDKLDFYIETPGGSGESAEEIVRYLRGKFTEVNFVVSGEAKSAGTIIVLSGNEIYMTKSGSLGPIDAQMKIGRSLISAYDYMEWVGRKLEEAEKNGKLNPFEATIIAQISPGELGAVEHSLKFAEDLVVEWIAKYKFKDWDVTETNHNPVTEEKKKERAAEIASHLINHGKWRSHGRSLKIENLEQIGLKIKKVDDDIYLSDIIYRIQTIIRLLFNTTNIYKIFATADSKIFRSAAGTQEPLKIPVNKANAVEFEVKCNKCGNTHKIYAKLSDDPQIDDELQKKGFKPFPHDNKLVCSCGYEIDLIGIRNEIEAEVGKKIVFGGAENGRQGHE